MQPHLLPPFGAHLEVFEFPLLLCELLLRGLDALDAVGGGGDGHEAAEAVLDRLEPVVAVDAEQVGPGKLKDDLMKQMVPCWDIITPMPDVSLVFIRQREF